MYRNRQNQMSTDEGDCGTKYLYSLSFYTQ